MKYTPDAKKWLRELGDISKNQGISFLNGYNRERILSILKGNRPSPSIYLSEEYILQHLNSFYEKASYIVPESILNKYGREVIGRTDGQFVMSGKELDDLLLKSNGDISYIEKELGIPEGWWEEENLVRIDIFESKKLNIRIPSGNESGANELWIPGGKLPTGYLEAVIDAVPQEMYIETIIKFK